MTDDTEERLKKILAEDLMHTSSTQWIVEETSLYGRGLGLNSLDAVSLIIRVEEEFDVFFAPTEIVSSLRTFGALLQIIRRKRCAREP